MNTKQLLVFDLDGTLVEDKDFYKEVYSGTLNAVVEKRRGRAGREILERCRVQYSGKGELALFALSIPFAEWASSLATASLELVNPNPELVRQVGDLPGRKVVYSGSPKELMKRLLVHLGFREDEFDLLMGWQEPEVFPVKWSCSSFPFETIAARFGCSMENAWSIGDTYETDLEPARRIGMNTIKVGSFDERVTATRETIGEALSHLHEVIHDGS